MAVEYRGARGLVFAKITTDDNETEGGYVTGAVKALAPVATISKTVETSSEAKYYDNTAQIVIDSEGADTISLTIAIPSPEVLAEITGRVYDSTKKMFIEAPRKNEYFALGYILGEVGEGKKERYVWRLKGTFNIPDETSQTEDNSTTSNNMTLTFIGIYTNHKFANGGGNGVKSVVKANSVYSDGTITETNFFKAVYTPDSVAA